MASELPRSSPKESRHGMCLPLNLDDQNNAFLPESSMSCTPYERGETSPDSMRSLSSLSSTRTDSPVDVDMSELEMGKLTANSDDSGIQSPDCRPMTSESNDNDNSVSVYLDANEDCWSDDENHNVTLVLEKKVDHLEEWSLFSENEDNAHASGEREEDLFLSISSEDLIMKSQASNQETDNLNEAELSCGEQGDDKIYTSVTTTEIFSSIQELSKSTHLPGDVLPKPHLKASSIKPTNHDVKRSFRPDLRNVKAKIISRPTQPIKTSTNLNHPASDKVKVSLSSSRTSKKCKTVEKSRSSSSHEKEAELMSQTCEDLQLADLMASSASREEAQKQPESQSADLLDEESPQFKNKPVEELPKNIRKTVSSKLGPSNAATSRPPESRLKQLSRDAKPTGGPGPPGGRVAQSAGVPRMRLTEKSLLPCGSSSVSSSKGLQKVASSKLPIKGLCSPTHAGSETISPAANKVHDEVIKSEDKSIKQSPSSSSSSSSSPVHAKTVTNKLTSGHRSKTSYTLSTKPATGLKAHAVASNITTKTTQNALPRNGAARLVRAMGTAVDKSSKGPKPAGTTAGRTAPHNPAGQSEEEDERDLRLQNEKKNQCILQLRKLIINGNRRLESLALVVQHIFSEREVAIKQKEALSIQLSSLREQLGNSVSCCEQLEKEKEEVRVSLEALLQKLEEQHQTELQQLEERLNEFYSAEWDKTHQAYQDEADKCRELMQQQVDDVRNKQEALRNQQEVAHTEQIKTLKHENETSLADLRKTHELHVQELDKTIKQSEAILNEKIQTLTAENEILKEKLQEEEEWRRAAAEKSQKDAHTLYLEQELESLRAVLEIKTNQMHQQDKKLMQMDKLIEDNLKLEECLKKVQQENEDYKARMDKHAALSKQLSSEQALLQQTLQKESKVNKRLSMENEELLWKLHNGDLCSPRHLSSSSPFSSPRNSASFSTSPLSPR